MNTPTQRQVTQADIDRSREVLERASFKLGKARTRSIMSTAQAAADAQDLQACVDDAAKAENDFALLAERFVTPPAQAPEASTTNGATAYAPSVAFPNGLIATGADLGDGDSVLRDAPPATAAG